MRWTAPSFAKLKSFSNVKTLLEEVSRCLRLEDGEHPLEVFPELQELTYVGSGTAGDAFTSFIDACQNAGRPVTLVRRSSSPIPSETSFEAPAMTSASDEAANNFDT
jgi:hypothetical protein